MGCLRVAGCSSTNLGGVACPSYWLETLGCAKNNVDSDKLAGLLRHVGYSRAKSVDEADLVVVNTCAFIEPAREESVEVVLALAGAKKKGARLVVTGCMAERYGAELARALPEVDQVAGFGVPFWGPGGLEGDGPGRESSVPVRLRRTRRAGAKAGAEGGDGSPAGSARRVGLSPAGLPAFDLLNLPRPAVNAPWAYVKIAEGCDRRCGFCAIPSFRGPQRSRSRDAILAEVGALGVQEVVLVAQDPVSWGRDAGAGPARVGIAGLVRDVRRLVERVRLLYLYPSGLSDELVDALGETGCPYFDISLQHVSKPHLRRMRRYGDAERFLERVNSIRRRFPDAVVRSSFVVGYPGETEADHDLLIEFLESAQLDWAGFFAFSPEEGTYAAALEGQVRAELVAERLRECSELQDAITAERRADLVGTVCRALVDKRGQARSHREAPEIDGIITVPRELAPGSWVELLITESIGPDLIGVPASRAGETGLAPLHVPALAGLTCEAAP
jgi:ribosomal protein S12 methylthiotransferase